MWHPPLFILWIGRKKAFFHQKLEHVWIVLDFLNPPWKIVIGESLCRLHFCFRSLCGCSQGWWRGSTGSWFFWLTTNFLVFRQQIYSYFLLYFVGWFSPYPNSTTKRTQNIDHHSGPLQGVWLEKDRPCLQKGILTFFFILDYLRNC